MSLLSIKNVYIIVNNIIKYLTYNQSIANNSLLTPGVLYVYIDWGGVGHVPEPAVMGRGGAGDVKPLLCVWLSNPLS